MSESDRFWDKKAQKYSETKIADEASYQKKLAETQEFLSPAMRVVEFGCGTGSTAIHHAPCVEHIDAIDVSENMLAIGREKAQTAGVDNITFSRGTLIEFNADEASVDVVLGLNIIHLLPERQATLAEVARILKPGGLFVSSTACIGQSYLRFIKLLVPLGKLLGQMPDVFVLTEAELAREIAAENFDIERQWSHGHKGMAVFMIARKNR